MPDPINYQAVLADLESKREQLDAAIAAIRAIMGRPELWYAPPFPKLSIFPKSRQAHSSASVSPMPRTACCR